MTCGEDESAIDFANRVKGVIAKQGGLVDLVWDGQLKRMKPKKEWMEKQQEEFTKRLKGEWVTTTKAKYGDTGWPSQARISIYANMLDILCMCSFLLSFLRVYVNFIVVE